MLSFQSCPTLWDPMDCSPLDSSVHGILQARTLEWVVMPSSRGSSWPRDRAPVSCGSCTGRRVLYRWATTEAQSNHTPIGMFKNKMSSGKGKQKDHQCLQPANDLLMSSSLFFRQHPPLRELTYSLNLTQGLRNFLPPSQSPRPLYKAITWRRGAGAWEA